MDVLGSFKGLLGVHVRVHTGISRVQGFPETEGPILAGPYRKDATFVAYVD